MPDREFLETYPLYRPLKNHFGYRLDEVAKVPIKMHCDVCSSDQTFLMVNEYFEGAPYRNVPVDDALVHLRYQCTSCQKFRRGFLIIFGGSSSVMKVGQWPAWDITVNKRIQRALGDFAPVFKKGLICESQGYGIAAFAYYRRIVESTIDNLLIDIGDLIVGTEHAVYLVALEKVKLTRVTQEKIDLVKDLLPPSLRPDGLNPLGILHSELSSGLHAETDEACLEAAQSVREILVFLLSQIETIKASGKTFTDSMRKLLQKRDAPSA